MVHENMVDQVTSSVCSPKDIHLLCVLFLGRIQNKFLVAFKSLSAFFGEVETTNKTYFGHSLLVDCFSLIFRGTIGLAQ